MIDWFYSDPHFGHKNIIGFCDRPFNSVGHMYREMASRYNEVVGPDDTVCFTGDVVFGSVVDGINLLRTLNGRKILVRGNHDGGINRCLRMGFELVCDVLHLTIGGRMVTVCHYPPKGVCRFTDDRGFNQPDKSKENILIHGHTHEKGTGEGRRVHVGVDAWDYRPVSVAAIDNLLLERGL